MDDIVSYNDWLSPMMRNEYAFLWIDESVGTHIADRTNYIIPRSLIAFVHHIVAILGADRDKHHVLDIQCLLHLLVVGNNLVVYIFTEINQVHLVDSHQDMWYAEQR